MKSTVPHLFRERLHRRRWLAGRCGHDGPCQDDFTTARMRGPDQADQGLRETRRDHDLAPTHRTHPSFVGARNLFRLKVNSRRDAWIGFCAPTRPAGRVQKKRNCALSLPPLIPKVASEHERPYDRIRYAPDKLLTTEGCRLGGVSRESRTLNHMP